MRIPCILAANFSRGFAILLVHEEEEITLVGLRTCNNCPLRTDSTFLKWFSTILLLENSSSRNSSFLFNSSNFWILLIRVSRSARSRSANTSWSRACSRVDCSYPVRVCPISIAWESICLFNSQIFYRARIRSVFMSQDLGFCFCEQLFLFLFQKWSWTDGCPDSWLDLRFCDIQWWVCPYLLKLIVHLETSFARTCFSLLKVQWWKPANSWCVLVNLSISEFLVCLSISASGYFASLSPRM